MRVHYKREWEIADKKSGVAQKSLSEIKWKGVVRCLLASLSHVCVVFSELVDQKYRTSSVPKHPPFKPKKTKHKDLHNYTQISFYSSITLSPKLMCVDPENIIFTKSPIKHLREKALHAMLTPLSNPQQSVVVVVFSTAAIPFIHLITLTWRFLALLLFVF